MTDLTLPIRLDPNSAPNETMHVTESGLPVRIYSINGGGEYPVHGVIYKDGYWNPESWTGDGRFLVTGYDDLDLRDRPQAKRGVWVAWFENENGTGCYAVARDSKEEASAPRYKCCLKGVTYLEEGDGLDTPADPPLVVDWSRLPDWAKWAAAGDLGSVWAYEARPALGLSMWRPNSSRGVLLPARLYRLAPDFDWHETLIQRPEDV